MTIFKIIARSIFSNPGNKGKYLEKSLQAMLWQFQKHILCSTRILRLPNGFLFKAYPDCVVSSALIYADWPEYHELMFLRNNLKENEVIVDVGAYVGHISLLLADIVGPDNIFAFEPTMVSFQRLVENWRLNGWKTGNLFRVALGAKKGTVFIPDRPSTTNKITASPTLDISVEVPLLPLDHYMQYWGKKSIGLLKIDVEGYEPEVFLGSQKILQNQRPRFIMFESLNKKLDKKIASIFKELEYIVFQLGTDGKPEFEKYEAQNLFAVPNEEITYIK